MKSKSATKQPVRYEEATFRNETEVGQPSDSAEEIDMPSSSVRYGLYTVKPVLGGHSKIDKTMTLKPCGSSMQVESIAECSPQSILQYF